MRRRKRSFRLIVIRLATASPSSGGHGEWSRRDASDIDGLSREAETSGSEKVNPSIGGLVIGERSPRQLRPLAKRTRLRPEALGTTARQAEVRGQRAEDGAN